MDDKVLILVDRAVALDGALRAQTARLHAAQHMDGPWQDCPLEACRDAQRLLGVREPVVVEGGDVVLRGDVRVPISHFTKEPTDAR